MKNIFNTFLIVITLTILTGCQTMHDGAQKGGEVVGKTVAVGEAVTEGAVDGYMSDEPKTAADNPYNR